MLSTPRLSDERHAYLPVSTPYRVGVQTLDGLWASRKFIPSAASLSKWGVGILESGLLTDKSPCPKSSARMRRMFGRSSAANKEALDIAKQNKQIRKRLRLFIRCGEPRIIRLKGREDGLDPPKCENGGPSPSTELRLSRSSLPKKCCKRPVSKTNSYALAYIRGSLFINKYALHAWRPRGLREYPKEHQDHFDRATKDPAPD